MPDKTFLDKVYDVETPEETRDLYDEWSASYDAEVAANGYVTPKRVAEALAQFADITEPVLDFGCGTGLSGAALKSVGFQAIDGVDISAEMIAEARTKGIYRRLEQISTDPLDLVPGTFGAIVATGVIGAGAAPLAVFDMLLRGLGPRNYFAFSFNDHTLQDPTFSGRVEQAVATGEARLLFEEYGDHLPGLGLKSTVYVLAKQ